ncbi:MAG: nitroreductase family protein [Acidimicrobiales bacterium]
MELSDAVRRRRMVRNYDPARPVPPEATEHILANAIRAPSAGFAQGWAFLVCESAAEREAFWDAATPPGQAVSQWSAGMRGAPLVIVPLSCESAYVERYAEADKAGATQRWPIPYWHVDTGFATLLMLLSAVDAGLGACFFGIPAERVDAFREAFGVPHTHTPIGAVTIGYPAPDRPSPSLRRGRRSLEEVVHRGHW